MKITFLASLLVSFFIVGTAQATMIDIEPREAPTQGGFNKVFQTNTTVDGITFYFTGALFDRVPGSVNAGAYTYADLYNDFAYRNDAGPIVLTMTGLTNSTEYDIRFYSSDRFDDSGYPTVMTNTFTPTTGTGSAVSVTWDRTSDPTSNLQNSVLGTFTSSIAGQLTFDITGAIQQGTGSPLVRINGLELAARGQVDPIPEPTTMLLLGTGLVGVAGAARRRKKNQA